MLRLFCAACALVLCWAPRALAENVGFATAVVPDPKGPPLAVDVWYPTIADARQAVLGPYVHVVASGGAVAGTGHPLIVMSHGTGGWSGGHFDTAVALAQAGFVVAAPTHTGDTYLDRSRMGGVADRPRHLQAVIDYMISSWADRSSLDPERVGAFGFSAGGFTVLVAIGGKPQLRLVADHCAANPAFFDCQLVRARPASMVLPNDDVWIHDARIRAAVIAAPALGFTFAPQGLRDVSVPVQLWRAELDEVLPHPFYAQALADALPLRPEYHIVPGAGHFDFMAPCTAQLRRSIPSVCEETNGFDRTAFHQEFNRDVVRFFKRTLAR